ncbi:MAG TPA: flagellar motor switch protein FliN [Sumerlaeia bacterium]|nr:flagellar motor switch protein FliN [Sumerlaeia bacterium]
MADELNPGGTAQESGSDDASWEDAFEEAVAGGGAEGQARHEVSGAQAAAPAVAMGSSLAEARQTSAGGLDIDFLLDLPLDLTVEVGRRKMLINEMLQLGQGSVIPLEKEVGEPFEVYVNGKLMAYAEVVVVNEKFGVRLTDVIDPKERLQQLT